MTPEEYTRVNELFRAALDLDPDRRGSFLDLECPDGTIRALVDGMLAADSEDESLVGPSLASSFEPDRTRDAVGGYRILGEIGRGGMGVVYEAEQASPHRRVALKILRAGLASTEMIRRFRIETEALGRLLHPGIARIYDAGVQEGEEGNSGRDPFPYFAMELVEGESIVDSVRRRDLSIRDRLELLAAVADAVQHAHQHGVIHRDLKPANILVDRAGRPKVLDFGVARIIGAEASMQAETQPGQIVGTLAYMSPEQVSDDRGAVDTRADVYALGALGMEMLSSARPVDLEGLTYPEAVRRVAEEVRPRLGSIDPLLRGDPETIIGKALSRDPDERYPSAAELAADIRRSLADEPITARPPSTFDQFVRFTRRNRALVGGVVGSVLAILAGLIATLLALERALDAEETAGRRLVEEQLARSRAEREIVKAQQTTRFLQDLLISADPSSEPDREVTVRELLDRFDRRLSELSEPEVEAALRKTLGQAYYGLSIKDRSVANLKRSVELFSELLGPRDRQTLVARMALASSLRSAGDVRGAIGHYEAAAVGLTDLAGPDDPDALSALNKVAVLEYSQGNLVGARNCLVEVHARSSAVYGPDDENTLSAAHNLAGVQLALGEVSEAEETLRDLAVRRERIFGLDDPRTARTLGMLGGALMRREEYRQAYELFQDLTGRQRSRLGETHEAVLQTRHNAAVCLGHLGRPEEALELERDIHQTLAATLGPEDPTTLKIRAGLASLLRETGDPEAAIAHYEAIVEVRARRHGADAKQTTVARSGLAKALEASGQLEAAEALFAECWAGIEKIEGPNHVDTLIMLANLAHLVERRSVTEAAEIFSTLAERARTLPPDDWNRGEFTGTYGRFLSRTDRPEEARPVLEEALRDLEQTLELHHVRTGKVRESLLFVLDELGDEAAAAALRAKSAALPSGVGRD